MAHGYLGDGYGKNGERDPDGGRDDDRDSRWRSEQRNQSNQSGERGQDRDRGSWSDRDRGFMLDSSDRAGEDQNGQDRGFLSRTAEQARQWFDQDEHDYRSRDQGSSPRGSGSEPRGERFAGDQHTHYRNWRQQQIDSLDRDYQDYCSERQQQFHSDFDSWRRNRQSGSGSQQQGQVPPAMEANANHDMDGTSGSTTDPRMEPQATVEPDSGATLGTNNGENSTIGR